MISLSLLLVYTILGNDKMVRNTVRGDTNRGGEIYTWQKKYNIPNGYGENEWCFTYKDSLQGYSRHIKTNRNDKHIYVFYFYREADKYFVDVNIKGVSPLQEKIELKKITKPSEGFLYFISYK